MRALDVTVSSLEPRVPNPKIRSVPEINFINGPSVQSVRTEGLIARCFRTTCLEPKPDIFLGFCAEDIYMVRLFLKSHPANTLVQGRRRISLPPRGSMQSAIRHVCEPFCWKMSHAVDVINFEIPTMAIHDHLQGRRSRQVSQLKVDQNASLADPTIASFGLATLQVLGAEKQFTQFFVDHIVDGLCKHVALQYFGANTLEGRRGGLAPWQERRAKDLMYSAIGRALSLQEVAEACGLSVGYFSRAFRKSTGYSPHKWLMEKRIEMALSLLSDDKLSLTDIAARCGFVDQSHLTRACNRHIGMPPGVYRRLAASAE
ncbi:helix-turn-helix transcriptional regulator [Bradyrhizobium tropiciagri]|uniref:helix-turn-helix transcriptional regulator n=1 Tax=Bradyrhizobium tropiciagri TaxID=312253 RepID=UPI001BAD9DEF|nr:helix-turn-helix transcriptional regulator [Bradyrhizobium tropiciagri]